MAKKNINIGQSVNDKTGDTLRSAFDKINQNFTELYTLTGGTAADLQELAQDYAAPLFNHASHTNITATYDDANNKILLTGVAAQVQSNWTAVSGLGVILNKPALFSGSYTDLTSKPTIPTSFSSLVNGANTASLESDGTITFPNDVKLKSSSNHSLSIGYQWDAGTQDTNALAIGAGAGAFSQGMYATALGTGAASYQDIGAVSIGYVAGGYYQGMGAVAIGMEAGTGGAPSVATYTPTGSTGTTLKFVLQTLGNPVVVGMAVRGTGFSTQTVVSVDSATQITLSAPPDSTPPTTPYGIKFYPAQGAFSIAIGFRAGGGNNTTTVPQANGTIVLNASNVALSGVPQQTNSFYVNPIRTDATPGNVLFYNTTTKEITYGTAPSTTVSSLVNGAYTVSLGSTGKLTAPGNLQIDGGKIILNTAGNAYFESVDYGVNSANSAVNIFGGPYQKINLRAGFGTQATWTFDTDGNVTVPGNILGNGTSLALSTGATAPGAAVVINTSEVDFNFSDVRGGFKFKNLGGATGSITFPDATVQTTAATTYTLPTATTSVLGGVKVDGTSVTISGGVISLNAGLSGSVTFKGGWNANTNTPTLANGSGTSGWMYIVTTAGTQNLGGGSTVYAASDLLIYDGTNWIKIAANNGVVSFNTRTGAVTLTSGDVTTALGFTPYNSTNPNNYISSITSGNVTTALGYTPLQSSSLSITTNTASGAGSLSYSSGVFTFTPAAAYSLPTATTGALGGVKVDGTTITIASGVIAVSSALTSATQFKGNWDASANTPTLSSSLPTGVAAGWEYIVSVGGTRDIGNSSTVWSVGDLVIYDGAKWVRIPSGNNVVSFNTRQGAITLTSGDVTTALGFTPVTAAAQIANKILAGPSTGADAAPTYRALVAADIPSLSYAPTAGSASITTLGTIATGTWNGSVIAGQYGGTGVANTGKTITLGGNLTTSGAFTTTLTTTAATTLTLPVTGTLATLLGTETLNNKTLGATTIAGHIIPDTDVTYDLGSATYRFRDLYLSGSSIKLGGATLTASGSALTIPASSTLTTPIIATNITTASTTFALVNTTATTVNFASGATTALNIGASTAPITGFASTATTSSTAASIGYLGLPQSATNTSATLVIGDAGKHIYVNTASQTMTIPANGTVAYPIGTTLTFIAGPSATTVSIAIATDTMYLAGTGTTGTRTLAAHGMATAVKVAATTWYINGTGLT